MTTRHSVALGTQSTRHSVARHSGARHSGARHSVAASAKLNTDKLVYTTKLFVLLIV